jgi:hypothetical protein
MKDFLRDKLAYGEDEILKMPFTVEQFFAVFGQYNTAIWPAQIIAFILGIAAIVFALRKSRHSSEMISGILSLFWIWMGFFYHIVFFRAINPIAFIFGLFFIFQGLLFLYTGIIMKKLSFQYKNNASQIIGIFFIVYAMILYPLIGLSFGHTYPDAPMFGVAPCPTTIFTFGLLLLTIKKIPCYLLIIPFLWSVIGVSAAINLQVPQDFGLIVAGILGTFLILYKNRTIGD